MVGNVPPQGAVKFNLVGATPACKYNFITLPLDQGAITKASQLLTTVGDVKLVLSWGSHFRLPGFTIRRHLFPMDFTVRIGYPYFLCMSASKTWPQ